MMCFYPYCRNCCKLHQQRDQEETPDTFSTWDADQQLQIPKLQMKAKDVIEMKGL